MKKALVCGAGGFIGHHLVKELMEQGYWVRGVDLKRPDYSDTAANGFYLLDLREPKSCEIALASQNGFDEIYLLAADRGGAGYMEPGECEMMTNNILINANMIKAVAEIIKNRRPKVFFSSSVCVYRDMPIGAEMIYEADVYPAFPGNEYGWEKLYTERMLLAFRRKYGLEVRIARFHTTYGPEANWEGGREKAADALCRKAALAKNPDSIEVWGDGRAVRNFVYIDDLIAAIMALMNSDINEPVNIGTDENVTVKQLANIVINASGKNLMIKYVPGAVGVEARYFSNEKIKSTGWKPKFSLIKGVNIHYSWVADQVRKKYS